MSLFRNPITPSSPLFDAVVSFPPVFITIPAINFRIFLPLKRNVMLRYCAGTLQGEIKPDVILKLKIVFFENLKNLQIQK